MAANWWDEDKAAGGDWWKADEPTPKRRASDALPGAAPGGKSADAFNVFMGERGQEMWDVLRKGGLGTGAILAELLPEKLKGKVQDAVARRGMAIDREQSLRDAGGGKEAMGALAEEFPVASIAGPATVDMSVPMGPITKGAGMLRTAAEMAVPGMIPGVLTREEQGANAMLSGGATAVGSALTGGIGRMAAPGMRAASPEAARLVDVAAREGIPLDAAQRTGSKVLQNTKAALNSIPWTAGAQQADEAARQAAYNTAILKRLKSNASAATPDVLADVHSRIVGDLGKAVEGVTLAVDDPLFEKLAAVEAKHLRKLPSNQRQEIIGYFDDIVGSIDKGIPGDAYATARSELGRLAYGSSHPQVVDAAKAIQKALDEAFDTQAPAAKVALMKEARPAYKLYMEVTDALAKSRNTEGNISPKQFYASVQRATPGFERGAGGEVGDIARAGRQFLPDAVPDSGTSQRAMYQGILTAGSLGGLGALGSSAMGGDPTTGAMLGLGGFAASKAARRALNSPGFVNHLGRGAALTQQQRALIARSGGLAGLGLASASYE